MAMLQSSGAPNSFMRVREGFFSREGNGGKAYARESETGNVSCGCARKSPVPKFSTLANSGAQSPHWGTAAPASSV